MTRAPLALVLLAGSLALACSGNDATPTSPTGTQPETAPTNPSPASPATSNGTELTLAPGQRLPVEGTSLSLQFVGVSNDSRCPADAFCVQLGEAIAVFDAALGSQPGSRLELRTSEASRHGHVGQYEIELVSLQPYPFSKGPIDPSEYRATLRVVG